MPHLEPVSGSDEYLWKYLPSVIPAAIALGFFFVLTGGTFWRMLQTRSWFCIAFNMGGFLQILGFAIRILSRWYTSQIAPYTIQAAFIVLAPVFYAATVYMLLGRIIRATSTERYALIRPARLTKVFVWGDVIALQVQGNAVGLTVKKNLANIGKGIILAGLVFQVLMLVGFLFVAIAWHRQKRNETGTPDGICRFSTEVPWRQGVVVIYACSILILTRSIFRIAEYSMGADGYLLAHEWTMYAFDTLPMLFVQAIFLVYFPSHFKILKEECRTDVGHKSWHVRLGQVLASFRVAFPVLWLTSSLASYMRRHRRVESVDRHRLVIVRPSQDKTSSC